MAPATRARSLTFREAYKLLVKPSEGPVSKRLNRHISIRITLFLIRHGIAPSPTGMSVISFLTGLASGASFALGWPLVGGLLAQTASILDGCDGEIARLTGRVSKRGGIIDAVLDRVADAAIIAGLSLYALCLGWPPSWLRPYWPAWPCFVLLLLVLSLSGSFSVSYFSAISRALASYQPKRFIGTRDVRLFTIMLAGLTCFFLPWASTIYMALLSLMTWAEVANCLGQAAKLRE